jgi:prepilin-type processing-associated H-X9-DG protein
MILPYIEQVNIYNSLDFKRSPQFGAGKTPNTDNALQLRNNVPTAHCPTDPGPPIKTQLGHVPGDFYPDLICASSYVVAATPFPNSQDTHPDDYVTGRMGLFNFNSHIRFGDITDGTSNTIMLGETYFTPNVQENAYDQNGIWYGMGQRTAMGSHSSLAVSRLGSRKINPPGTLASAIRGGFRSLHGGGVNCGMADGSVRFVSETIDQNGQTWDTVNRRPTGGWGEVGLYQKLFARNDGTAIPTNW